jgi:hypothetical protein
MFLYKGSFCIMSILFCTWSFGFSSCVLNLDSYVVARKLCFGLELCIFEEGCYVIRFVCVDNDGYSANMIVVHNKRF